MKESDLYYIFFLGTFFFMFLTGFIVYFVLLYQKRQVQNKLERENLEAAFNREVLNTKIEIQEQTFNYVSREIHDNITQVLSFIKLNLAMVAAKDESQKQKIGENRELIAQVITDLRDLSKSLSFEHIARLGLVKTLETEVKKINKSGIISAELVIDGDVYPLGEQKELVLFRIFQEAFNNTTKYAEAKNFTIKLQYIPQSFKLILKDDGVGFSHNALSNSNGSGLSNIESRAALIGAAAKIDSSPGEGCNIVVTADMIRS